jgi:thiol-disulfide isomerase/thioredoxin
MAANRHCVAKINKVNKYNKERRMDALHIGPLAVPMQVVLVLAGVLLAQAVAAAYKRAGAADPGPVLWKMMAAGLIAGRLVFVLRHRDLYLAAPWTIVDLRDGGIEQLAAFAAAFVVGAELAQRARLARLPLAVAALAGCMVFFGGGALNRAFAPALSALPDVVVRRLDGSAVPLRAFVGRPLVVNLWASWCPPCRREMPALRAAQLAHPEVDFVFLNQGESAATVERYLGEHASTMVNVLLDPARQASARTASSAYPTTLFYGAGGTLQARHMGELSAATLADKIDQLSKMSKVSKVSKAP